MTAKTIAAAKLAGHLIEGENGQALTDADLSKLTYSIGYGAYYVPDGVEVPLLELPSSSEANIEQLQPEEDKEEKTEIEQLRQQLESYQKSSQERINQLEEKVNQLETSLKQQKLQAESQPKTVQIKSKTQTRDWESISRNELFGLGKHEHPVRGKASTNPTPQPVKP